MRSAFGPAIAVAMLALPPAGACGQAMPPSLDRAGGVRIGESVDASSSGAAWKAAGYVEAGSASGCEYYSGALLPEGVSMMAIDGEVVRFDLHGSGGVGPFEVGVGDSEALALEKLPEGVAVSQHHYGEEGDHYLTWIDPDSGLAIRVETWEGRVERMYWGTWETVQYVEGCL